MQRFYFPALAIIFLFFISSAVFAEVVQLQPVKDNSLYENVPDNSNGSGKYLFMGQTGEDNGIPASFRRALLQFDVSAMPANAVIESVQVSLTINKIPSFGATPDFATLHRILRDWGEGTSNAPGNEGQGIAAQPGDATWNDAFFNTDSWAQAGGDFEVSASASTPFGASEPETMTFVSTPGLIADVQGWVKNPASNFGWILRGDENTRQNARRMASREHTTDPVPVLTIEFSVPSVVDHLGVSQLTASLTNPIAIANAGDGSNRLFVVEQEGIIRIYDLANNTLLQTPFLNITNEVDNGGNEQGLLGLAFHPDYGSNGQFYVYYTRDPGPDPEDGLDRSVVALYKVSAGDANVANAASAFTLLEFEQDAGNHNGGDLHFGADGYLYIASGDGGGGNDQFRHAQDLDSLKGKLLRVDVNSIAPANDELCGLVRNYGIPPGNPFTGAFDGCDEIFHFGLRNPWRFSFDAISSDMYIADVGQNIWEEINFVPDGSAGVNYGWSCREGMHDFLDGNACISAFTDPVLEYSHGGGRCSVTGGYLYRGSSLTIYGHYIYGDYCTGQIWLARQQDGVWTSQEWISGNPMEFGLSAFGQDENCELYMVNRSTRTLYRFIDSEFLFRGGFESPGCG
jgi:glucose/arabinose dehydrogenase